MRPHGVAALREGWMLSMDMMSNQSNCAIQNRIYSYINRGSSRDECTIVLCTEALHIHILATANPIEKDGNIMSQLYQAKCHESATHRARGKGRVMVECMTRDESSIVSTTWCDVSDGFHRLRSLTSRVYCRTCIYQGVHQDERAICGSNKRNE
jgi:hypothetical protein